MQSVFNNSKTTLRIGVFLFLCTLLFTPNAPGGVTTAQAVTPVYGWTWPTGMELNGSVYDIEIDGSGNLYVGGNFTNAGGDPDADYIAYWNTTTQTWSWPTGMGLNSSVRDIEIDGGGNLFIGGQFFNAGGDLDADFIAYWDGANWSWPNTMGLGNIVYDIEIDSGGNLFVGGNFTSAGGDPDGSYIAYWDGASWSWPNAMGLNDRVYDIEIDGSGNLFVGGEFINAGGDLDGDRIAYWDGANWSWPNAMGLNFDVYEIEIDGSGNLFVGGWFSDAGGDPDADNIAYWNGSAWSWPTGMELSNIVYEIEIDGSGNLFVGGQFFNAGGDPDGDSIAYWDGANWSWPTAMGLIEPVYEIEIDGSGNLYVGGRFTDAGGDPDADKIAVWTDAPQVVSTTLNTTTATVAFSEDVYDPARNTDTDDVTNPANYLVFGDGGDNILDTTTCPTVNVADTAVTVSSVAYDSGTRTATLTFAAPLTAGQTYGIMVCGTTSIVDLFGLALAGDGATVATDYLATLAIPAAAAPAATSPTSTSATLPATGFPMGKITDLTEQPSDKAYTEYGDLWLEIPSLDVQMEIVGVPQNDGEWDTAWLGENAGWLNGSAFPTWEGNTVLTGHVWDSWNQPGPFRYLRKLDIGDTFTIHAYGSVYTYEVTSTKRVYPSSVASVFEHSDYDIVTLLTCESYSLWTGGYRYRRAVQAILIDISAE